MNKHFLLGGSLIVTAAFVVACGGGGGSSPAPPVVQPTASATAPNPTPTATQTPTAGPTASPTITPTLSPSPTPTETPTPTPTATPTVKPTFTPVPTASPTPVPTPTVMPSYLPNTVMPVFDCVSNVKNKFFWEFGYINNTGSEQTFAAGSDSNFIMINGIEITPQSQPEVYPVTGTTEAYRAFKVPVPGSGEQSVTWTLDGNKIGPYGKEGVPACPS